jgi:ATP-dependent exoDNAse (exonuclease V) beta subunit
VNFRSQAAVVAWLNEAFAQVMPLEEDIAAGAVPYVPSEPHHPALTDSVRVHAFFDGDEAGEADRVAELVESAQADGTVAILVRSRNHLEQIMPRLKVRGVRFRAIEIEQLQRRQVVQDLLALTRALAHPADRLAWLAVLRAPWCGLTLADLHAIAGTDQPPTAAVDVARPKADPGQGDLFSSEVPAAPSSARPGTLWEALCNDATLARVSSDGRARLARIREALAHGVQNRLRGPLRERVEAAWLALGGPACVADDTDLEDAETYLDYLEKAEEAGELPDPVAFEEGLEKLYALPDLHAASDAPQVLTIHKAKGLEFDTVIVAGLGSGSARDRGKLFEWMERAESGADSRLLIAPINPAGGDEEPTYKYVQRLDRRKEDHEEGRLLYVAATRARKRLHLVGMAWHDAKAAEIKRPARGALLAKLWPVVSGDFVRAAAEQPKVHAGATRDATRQVDQDLRRLVSGWETPAAPPSVRWAAPVEESRSQDDIEFSWVGDTARKVGVVVHRWMQRIADEGPRAWGRARVDSLREGFRNELAALGVRDSELDESAGSVSAALAQSLEDPRGRWLLAPQVEARNEYRVTAIVSGQRRSLVIDRTFTDSEGVRWIVDYKTSHHEGADREAFLDSERERYRDQLERYAAALGARPASLGLYFPLLGAWREWERG